MRETAAWGTQVQPRSVWNRIDREITTKLLPETRRDYHGLGNRTHRIFRTQTAPDQVSLSIGLSCVSLFRLWGCRDPARGRHDNYFGKNFFSNPGKISF
jgi:hypothetical protein